MKSSKIIKGNNYIQILRTNETHKEYLDRMGETLGFEKLADWYNITMEKFQNMGGCSLLANNHGDQLTNCTKIYISLLSLVTLEI